MRSLRTVSLFSRRIFPVFLAPLLLAFAGCTHIERTVSPGRNPATLKEIFVVENLSDNHRVGAAIAAELRLRGIRAEVGPLTMLPESAEAELHYDDRWTWDFGEHMTYLRLNLHDRGEKRPYASAYRLRHVANSTDVRAVVKVLLPELLRPAP